MQHRDHRRRARIVAVAAAALALGAVAAPPARAEPLPSSTERLVGLARVWAKAKFYHPYLAYKDVDWDDALVAAIPKVEAAKTVAEYGAAVQGMLAALKDPVTRVIDAPPPPAGAPAPADAKPKSPDATPSWMSTPAPDVLEVKLAAFTAGGYDYVAMRAKATQVSASAAKAKVLIVDLRGAGVEFGGYAFEQFVDALPAIDAWPLERTLQHRGYRTQEGQTSGGYFSSFVTDGARPPKAGPKAGVEHVVFVVDATSPVPSPAIALQAAGRATIVAHGALDEAGAVTTTTVKLPGGLSVRVRLGELLWGPPAADLTVARADELEARARAVARSVIAAAPRAKPRAILALPQLRARDDLDYADQPYPARERRILAGIRMWAVLDNFFPYRYLIADWDGALRDALPALIAAPDRDAYRRALRVLSVRAGDGHIGVRPAVPDPTMKRREYASVETRLVEGKVAVVRLLDPAEAAKQGVAVGDVIETIDGKPALQKLADMRAEVSGSTDEARDQRIASGMLAGEDGTTVAVGLRGAAGALRTANLTRAPAHSAALWGPSTAPHWKKLAGNIGYADLTDLLVSEVGAMFDDLKDTRAIIFDMRGYPKGTAWAIAPRINTKQAKYGAQFLQPLAIGFTDDLADMRVRFLQQIPELPKEARIYTGRIVVLIDDRAISQAEHSCLFYASAAGATFVGSPTHGANGDVTVMRLPGGLRMSFTGQEVRHVDGRQLQKVGVLPDVTVRPTLAGLRAGKDEVLDRALAWLATKK